MDTSQSEQGNASSETFSDESGVLQLTTEANYGSGSNM